MIQTISWLVLNLILEGIIEWNLQWPVISESLIWATLLQVGSRENGNAGHDYKREDFISSNFWCSRNEYLGVGRKVLQLARLASLGPPTMLVVQKRWALMKLLPKARSSAELDGSQVIEGNFLFSGIWWCLWWAKTSEERPKISLFRAQRTLN